MHPTRLFGDVKAVSLKPVMATFGLSDDAASPIVRGNDTWLGHNCYEAVHPCIGSCSGKIDISKTIFNHLK